METSEWVPKYLLALRCIGDPRIAAREAGIPGSWPRKLRVKSALFRLQEQDAWGEALHRLEDELTERSLRSLKTNTLIARLERARRASSGEERKTGRIEGEGAVRY